MSMWHKHAADMTPEELNEVRAKKRIINKRSYHRLKGIQTREEKDLKNLRRRTKRKERLDGMTDEQRMAEYKRSRLWFRKWWLKEGNREKCCTRLRIWHAMHPRKGAHAGNPQRELTYNINSAKAKVFNAAVRVIQWAEKA